MGEFADSVFGALTGANNQPLEGALKVREPDPALPAQTFPATPGASTPEEAFAGFADEVFLPSPGPGVLAGSERSIVRPGSAGFTTGFKAGLVEDPETRIEIFAKSLFPEDPNARQRFGVLNDRIVFVNDAGELQEVEGGTAGLGNVAAFAPEAAGAAIGSAATLASGPAAPVTGSVLGAIGGKGIKQIIAGIFLDDPQTTAGNVQGLATEGVTALIGGGVGKGVVSAVNRRAIRDLGRLNIGNAKRIQAQVKADLGIDIDLAQASGLKSLAGIKRYVANFPAEAGDIMQAHADLQSGQVSTAINKIMSALSRETNSTQLGQKGMNAARAAVASAKLARAEATNGLYNRAFQAGGRVDTSATIGILDDILSKAKGRRFGVAQNARKLMNKSGGKSLDDTVDGLHETKVAIDELITEFQAKGQNTIVRDLTQVKTQLLDDISAVSPLYDQARKRFSDLSNTLVDPLEDSIVGTLARMEDRNAIKAANAMFSGQFVSQGQIASARTAMEKVDPAGWRALTRQWLDQNFNRAMRETQTGEVVNVAGKFRQSVFGTPQQKAAMVEALGGGKNAKSFETLMDAFKMISSTPTASSQTEFMRMISEELGSKVLSTLQAALAPLKKGGEVIQDRARREFSRKLAEALTNPAKVNQLRVLTQLRPSTERAVLLTGVVFGQGVAEAGEDFLSVPTNQPPPVSAGGAPQPSGNRLPLATIPGTGQ